MITPSYLQSGVSLLANALMKLATCRNDPYLGRTRWFPVAMQVQYLVTFHQKLMFPHLCVDAALGLNEYLQLLATGVRPATGAPLVPMCQGMRCTKVAS